MTDLLSIIVPVYGEDEYIDACVKSIVNQTYRNLEIILVDDGSPDKCPEKCDEWAAKDNRIKVIHKINGGLVSARKAGIEVATGGYIGYVDGDDWIDSSYYEEMMKSIVETNSDIAISGFAKDLFGKDIKCENSVKPGVYQGDDKAEVINRMICDEDTNMCGIYTYLWNKVFKKDIVTKYQMAVDNRVVIGEDATVVYPAILEADRICINSIKGYHYRQRMNSLLRNTVYKEDSILKLKVFYDNLYETLKNHNQKESLINQLNSFYFSQLLMMSDNVVHFYPEVGGNFPFFAVEENSKIAVFSAGAYGIHVYNQFVQDTRYEVVAWADPDYEQYDGKDDRIVSIEEMTNCKFDYCLIASVDKHFVESNKSALLSVGVDEKKICTVFDQKDAAYRKIEASGLMKREL